jgi:eukaryotic-like serine/threonine-protein kinase
MVKVSQIKINNRYLILNQIGSGGMADIYLAQDTLLERQVAIKILKRDFSRSPDFQQRFVLEAKAAANLFHPNIVTVFDFGFYHSDPFIVMEYVPGSDLKTLIRHNQRFSIKESLELMILACAGLGYAHRAGLVHCDVKPQNMLITIDHKLKITDFGIARALVSINPNERNDVVWGSPLYFSPEQANGIAPSPSSDVYSLGIVMYEILTGKLPYSGNTSEELTRMHSEVLAVPPSKLNPQIPEALDQIVLKVISKEPSSRYRNADQLGRVLSLVNSQFVDKGDTTPTKVSRRTTPPLIPAIPRKNSPSGELDWGTIGMGLLALFLFGGLFPFWLYIYYYLISPIY